MIWTFSIPLFFSTAYAQEGTLSAPDTQEGFSITEEEQEDDSPKLYIIQAGDTLWDLSTEFLGEAKFWPKLWSINEYITNPHWIYPGNEIAFTLGTEIDPPQIDILNGREGYVVGQVQYESTDAMCGPDIRFDFQQETGTYTVPGFLSEDDDIDKYGIVEASPHNQSFVVDRNRIYLRMSDPEQYKCGDVLTIFRQVKKRVRHPNSFFKKYGSMYRIVGEAKVLHFYGNYVVAEVRTSYGEIYRNDLVGPLKPAVVQLDVMVPNGNLQGVIIDQLAQEHSMTINRDTVFLDRGSDDGVSEGDSFYVVQQRDYYLDPREENPELPPSVIGRIVVVKVDKNSSVAVVTDATTDLEVGATITQEVK
jgi:hypothetical protein